MRNVPSVKRYISSHTQMGIHMKFYVLQNRIIPDSCREILDANVCIFMECGAETWHTASAVLLL